MSNGFMTEYVELHCHSAFSLLDGASMPDELVAQAAGLGLRGLALTDHNAVYGAVAFAQAAQERGVQPIFGAEMTQANGHHLTLLVENERGWANLCTLISRAQMNAPKGEASLPPELLAEHSAGLILLTGCRQGELPSALLKGETDAARQIANQYLDWFDRDNVWMELQQHYLPGEGDLMRGLVTLAEQMGVGVVATNNVHYATPEGHQLQDVLVCIRHQTTLERSARLRRPNSEYYLKSPRQMGQLFAAYPQAITNTRRIAERCQFRLHYGLQDLPVFPTPADVDAPTYLKQLCLEQLVRRYGEVSSTVHERLEYELGIIERGGLSNYFLVVWDIVRFARTKQIRCQGRGSAANSLVAYVLGITPIDPLHHDLVFERFLSDERRIAPDIDIDFQADRREEVIQYIYERYGHDHSAMACTYITFRSRSAIRDVGKALGLPLELIDQVSKSVDHRQALEVEGQAAPIWQQVFGLCQQIQGLPRHLGIHNGGMIITATPLIQRIPTEPATMPGRVVVQWDKQGLEDAGLVKIDILGLRMLSAVAQALDSIEAQTGTRPDLDSLTFDDPAIYDMLCAADTVGVFQVESRAQAQLLPRLQPREFSDLILSISLIRPGPIQGNMVHPFLRRRLGEIPVTHLHPLLQETLRETLGVILFQEQVLKVARDLAGFTPGQGELLRRALGSKHAHEAIEELHSAFIMGAASNGVTAAEAEAVFDRLRAFGGYSFPKSHAAAFAVLVYQSAWLKYYHPAPFFAALLNNQPMGFWTPAVLIGDARRHGVGILPVSIQHSDIACTVEDGAIRLGLTTVDKLGDVAADRVVAARRERTFRDLKDFCQRTRLPRRLVERLILVDAFAAWGVAKRQLLWDFGKLHYPVDELDLVYPDDGVELPPLTVAETLQHEYHILGLSPDKHPLLLYRDELDRRGILGSQGLMQIADGYQVQVAGLTVVRQAPRTAKGVVFLTLEDEHGFINVILYPALYDKYRQMMRQHPMLLVTGTVQRREKVINVLAERLMPLQRLAYQQPAAR